MTASSRPSAIVTGAAHGTGRAIADTLLRDGWQVLAVDRDPVVAERLGAGSSSSSIVIDIADLDAARVIVDAAIAEFGRVDALVNNAGIGGATAAVVDLEDDELQSVLDVNLLAAVRLCRHAIPHLRGSARGRIVNVGSLFAAHPVPEGSAYCMSKAALTALSGCLALELGADGITVNTVAPGYILTRMHRAEVEAQAVRLGEDTETRMSALRGQVPLGRHGTPADVAEAVAWLVGEASSYVTGQVIAVDGGVRIG